MSKRFFLWIALAAAALLVAACGGGDGVEGGGIGGTGSPASVGTLHVSLTDAPACGYDAVWVTVEKVRVHQSPGAADGDGGWSEVVLPTPRRVNLLDLTNGVLADLGQVTLPPGKYQQLRLVLAANRSANTFANSVVPTGGGETALTVTSADQTGIKVNLDLDIVAGRTAELVLDFDACKSVVRRGNSGQYNLKPVVSAIVVLSDAGLRIVGYVAPPLLLGTTNVSVQVAGKPIKATLPDASGRYELYPVPAGSHDVVFSLPGRVTALVTGVPVTTSAVTTLGTPALPITPPAATLRSVTGSVAPASATLRALQSYNGGPQVEVAWGAVDALSGAFTFQLPIEAPVRTGYTPNPAGLGFVIDPTAAGRYTLEATSAGTTKTQAINAAAPVPPVTFAF